MRNSRLSRLAVYVLQRCVPDSEPLAGDLLEEVQAGRSRLWLWRQIASAILLQWVHPSRAGRDRRPLKLADPSFQFELAELPSERRRQINLTGVPAAGVGGLGVVAIGVLITIYQPAMWWLILLAMLGGALLGLGLIALSRHRISSRPPDSKTTFLHDAR